jgi:hypothetical protein
MTIGLGLLSVQEEAQAKRDDSFLGRSKPGRASTLSRRGVEVVISR